MITVIKGKDILYYSQEILAYHRISAGLNRKVFSVV